MNVAISSWTPSLLIKLFVWALLIGYAQVYVGKHYVFGIVGGAIYGVVIVLVPYKVFECWCLKTKLVIKKV